MRASLSLVTLLVLTSHAGAQQNVIVPGDNLVVDGVPKIPATLGRRGRALHRVPLGEPGRLAPDPARDAHRHPLRRHRPGPPRQVPRRRPHAAHLLPRQRRRGHATSPRSGDYFVFAKDAGGNERFQIYRYDLATGDVTLLTDGKSRNSGGVWCDRRRPPRLHLHAPQRRRHRPLRHRPRRSQERPARAEVEGGGWGPLDWSPTTASSSSASTSRSTRATSGWSTSATERKRGITPQGRRRARSPTAAASSARTARASTSPPTGTPSSSAWPTSTWPTTKHTRPHRAHPVGRRGVRAVARRQDASPSSPTRTASARCTCSTPRPARRRRAPKLPARLGRRRRVAPQRQGPRLPCSSPASRRRTSTRSTSTTGKVERWTESETGGLNTAAFAEPELVRWKSFDGRKISGFLYRPPAQFPGKRPVIINIHGGPEGQFRPRFLGRNNYFLNELGVAILFPNVRGSAGYGKTFLKLDNGFKREDSYKDIGALLDWIKTRPDLDADRIMVTGGSYGGYMTLAVATYYPDRIRCAVDVVGISNFVTLPREHRELPPRPAPGRVRRRARPEDARVPGADRPAQQRRQDHAGRCSSSRARTTRACRSARPSRWSRRSRSRARRSGT